MFKHITINLSGPICSCEEEHLIWGMGVTEDRQIIFEVYCRRCGVRLMVPYDSLKAKYHLDVPYPKVPDPSYLKIVPSPKKTGKVIPLRPPGPYKSDD